MKAKGRLWTDKEMIIALDLYFRIPFGKLYSSNPDIVKLASLLDRTPNSIALRLVNYAACDPYIKNTGRTGMTGGLGKCLQYWEHYSNKREQLFMDATKFRAELTNHTIEDELLLKQEDFIGKEREAVIKQRVNQNAFRSMILANYEEKCAITGINIPQLLIASHIIPWADDKSERLNPENGICLSPLYDKAFDKGFIGIKTDYSIIFSREILKHKNEFFYEKHFASIENQKIILPTKHAPNKSFLEYHLNHIFKGTE